MRVLSRIIPLPLALLAASAQAQGLGQDWTTATAPNGALRVATPCTQTQIDNLRQAPPGLLPDVNIPTELRVLCVTGGAMMLAGLVEDPSIGRTGPSIFELLSSMLAGDPSAEGTATSATVGGRRAVFNRQESEGIVAQTGFIEVSRTKIVLVVAGGIPNTRLSNVDQGVLIDRFFQSIEVVAP